MSHFDFDFQVNELNECQQKLSSEYSAVLDAKNQLETSLATERAAFEQSRHSAEEHTNQLHQELEMSKKQVDNLDMILIERTRHRDEYVAKIAILEEQLAATLSKLTLADQQLVEMQTKVSDAVAQAQLHADQLAQEKKSNSEFIQSHGLTDNLMSENLNKLKSENEGLVMQINLLQAELSKMGQDLIVLQRQDSFKSAVNESYSTPDAMNTSMSESSGQSTSNLLEINRYLRNLKEQAEDKYESVKLTFEINQQRLKTCENDLDFYKKQSQAYESEIAHLKSVMESSENPSNLSTSLSTQSDNLNLMLETNKRLKDEIDALNLENAKLRQEIAAAEEEMSNVRASLSESEMRNESIKGENNCMRIELKRWKDRVDNFLNNSDNSAEWNAIKEEMQAAQQKSQELTDIINELRRNASDSSGKFEEISRDFEAFRTQAALDKSKSVQDFENLRTDKTKREETFKSLVNDLKEVVTTVQRELQLKDVDWVSMRGPMNEKLKFIKEELANVKKMITEKVKRDKEELATKCKQVVDASNELASVQKRLDESDSKLKEKETRIGQLNNFIGVTKPKLQAQKKTIDDLTKELSELKSSSLNQQHGQQQSQEASDLSHKTEIDTLKSRYLQSKFENERLKKELESTNSALIEAHTKIRTTSETSVLVTANTTITSKSTTSPQQPKQQQQVAASVASAASTATNAAAEQPQSTPTAYITPSRINKVFKVYILI